jgi:1-acyl-sn-glycerol-3-phosphate acyltransferase
MKPSKACSAWLLPLPMRTEGRKSTFTQRWRWNKHAPKRGFYNGVLRVFYKVLARHRVVNPHNMPKSGGVILMINHVSWADPFLVLAAVGRLMYPMAKVETFEDARTRWLVEPYGSIPVHRGAVDLQAIKAASEVLNEGGVVLISPEGTRSKTGGLIRAQEGLAFLATRTQATLVPVAIVGSPDIIPSLKRLRRADVLITLGEPFRMDTGGKKADRAMLQSLTDDAMHRLAALLPPGMRGVYGSAESQVPSPVHKDIRSEAADNSEPGTRDSGPIHP